MDDCESVKGGIWEQFGPHGNDSPATQKRRVGQVGKLYINGTYFLNLK